MKSLTIVILFSALSCYKSGCALFDHDQEVLPCEFEKTPLLEKDTMLIFGTWDWLYDNQNGPRSCIKHTPQSVGYNAYVVFGEDRIFERYQDGLLVERSQFRFDYSSIDLSGLSIFLGIGDGAPYAFRVSADTMVLDRSAVDGPQSLYVRRH